MKTKRIIASLFIAFFLLAGCSTNASEKKTTDKTESSTVEKISDSSSAEKKQSPKKKKIALAGTYYTNEGSTATVEQLSDQEWKITYQVSEGEMTATFIPDWQSKGADYQSKTQMSKSDGDSGFKIDITAAASGEIKLTMSDGNPDHQMTFSNQKPKVTADPVLQGDLSTFEGSYSNDTTEKAIAESGFTLNGYTPTNYYQNQTTVFPGISKSGEDWIYWAGSSHAHYKMNKNQLPKKTNGYYEVTFLGTNAIAIEGKELVLTLVPSGVSGPDGKTSDENRIFFDSDNQESLREYHDEWWKAYQSKQTETDLDVEAILTGDFATLAGTWKNGEGRTLTINADGTTDNQEKIVAQRSEPAEDGISYVSIMPINGGGGAAIALYKIGATNPEGDQSDTTRPRIIITQNSGSFPAEEYYYRQD
ncbi:DUF6287 domain-containing protein [Enterococcus xiangfangensis]|uniref:DUF6287 domain-containing protein n=1 Tax=Enterococcus xiangfangensis TaxID=1296537 RepID=A0ABU3F6C1_9ENTE|nr:DUF6287 domain-containing protein [Enterococcus xiangfangensis]MDT2758219.1 DUF6287 domain-containing protein [Enterococcus xiangfangensis]